MRPGPSIHADRRREHRGHENWNGSLMKWKRAYPAPGLILLSGRGGAYIQQNNGLFSKNVKGHMQGHMQGIRGN